MQSLSKIGSAEGGRPLPELMSCPGVPSGLGITYALPCNHLLRAVLRCARAELLLAGLLQAIEIRLNSRSNASHCNQEPVLGDSPRPGVRDDRSNHVPRGSTRVRRPRHDELLEISLLSQAVNFGDPL